MRDSVDYQRTEIVRFGPGSGGGAGHFEFTVQHVPDVPCRKTGVSDAYDYSFQFLCSIARGHTLVEFLRLTFLCRLKNPIGRVFIGYFSEPEGLVSIVI